MKTIFAYALALAVSMFLIWLFVEAVWALYYLSPELFG